MSDGVTALPDDPTRIARALRLLDACEACDLLERGGERGGEATMFFYDSEGMWIGRADGISCRVGSLVSALLHVGGSLAAERRK